MGHVAQINRGHNMNSCCNVSNNPFEFFDISVSFKIDEDILRNKYFQYCMQYRDDKNKLMLAHQHYKLLQNSVQRLDFILHDIHGINLENQATIASDVVNLYEEISNLSPDSCDSFIAKIIELYEIANETIQQLLEQKDFVSLREWRNRILYYEKFISEAYKTKLTLIAK
jgi:hypothetical protein